MSSTSLIMAVDPAVDLAIAQTMADELEDYLVNDDLFRPVIAHTPAGDMRLTMTGASLLSRLHRLEADREALTPEQQQQLDALQAQVAATVDSLKTRFHERLQREMKARLNSLQWFLDDCAEGVQSCKANFPFEMRNRQRIEEILKELGDDVPVALVERLQGVDRRIQQLGQRSDFIWDPGLEHVFPRDPYWYLYMRP